MALEEDSNAAMARLLNSVLVVETELEGVIQRSRETSDTSVETKSGEEGVALSPLPMHSSLTFFVFYS